MLVAKGTSHEHDYSTIELIRITRVQKNYQGTAGDKALLIRKCTCGKFIAFEYGNYRDMKDLQEALTLDTYKVY